MLMGKQLTLDEATGERVSEGKKEVGVSGHGALGEGVVG